jgi:hypothetical protein
MEAGDPRRWIGHAGVARLAAGTPKQRRVQRAVLSTGVDEALGRWNPTLVGTFPIAVDVRTSDIDIICHTPDLDAFRGVLEAAFGGSDSYRSWQREIDGLPTRVALFHAAGFLFEVFGQARQVERQHAFTHMLVEARLLAIGGERARRAIRGLKRKGLKTEPAFARYFGIAGDPYRALLALESIPDAELIALVASRGLIAGARDLKGPRPNQAEKGATCGDLRQ